MALPACYARASMVYGTDDKSPFVNILWYEFGLVPDLAAAQSVADSLCGSIDAAVGGLLRACICEESRYLGIALQLNVSGVVFDATSNASAGVGTSSGDTLPDYCAVVIRKRTAVSGRSGQGRWYVGAVPEVMTNTSSLLSTGYAAFTALKDAMITPINTMSGDAIPSLHSHKDQTLYALTAGSVTTNLGTQRGRKYRPTI